MFCATAKATGSRTVEVIAAQSKMVGMQRLISNAKSPARALLDVWCLGKGCSVVTAAQEW